MTKEIYIPAPPTKPGWRLSKTTSWRKSTTNARTNTHSRDPLKGKVTRVLPGMQSAFVDIGLERDAFLYVTDFAEEQEDGEEYVPLAPGQSRSQGRSTGGHSNGGRGATEGDSHANVEKSGVRSSGERSTAGQPARESWNAPGSVAGDEEGPGGRRWRGRRGRRRGRGGSSGQERPSSNGQGGLRKRSGLSGPSRHHSKRKRFQSAEEFEQPRQDFTVPSVAPERFTTTQAERPRSEQPRSEQFPMVLQENHCPNIVAASRRRRPVRSDQFPPSEKHLQQLPSRRSSHRPWS